MMTTNCSQVPVSPLPVSRKDNFDKGHINKDELDEGSNHSSTKKGKRKSGVLPNQQQPTAAIPFPWKLHRILDDADAKGFNDIVSWVPSENGFKVHKTKQFDDEIMPKYFDKTKYKSFQRQLNMWGFDRVGTGSYKGAYLHPCFVRGQPQLCESMQRTKIKGIHSKKLRKNFLTGDPLGGGSNHSLGASSHHTLGGRSSQTLGRGSNHSLGGTCHSTCSSSVMDVRASIEAAAQKVADLERQKEEIQRKLKMVSNSNMIEMVSNTMSSSQSSTRMITPHGSLHSREQASESSENDFYAPLPLSGRDSLLFGGRKFFFIDDEKNNSERSPQRRRAARRFSLEPKTVDSDEYILKEMPDFFGDDSIDDKEVMSPTPLPPNLNVVKATTDIANIGNHNSSLVINLDRPSRRFSFLNTPVQNPFEKPPRPSFSSRGGMNNMDMMNMNMNMNMMNGNNQINGYPDMNMSNMSSRLSNSLRVSSSGFNSA